VFVFVQVEKSKENFLQNLRLETSLQLANSGLDIDDLIANGNLVVTFVRGQGQRGKAGAQAVKYPRISRKCEHDCLYTSALVNRIRAQIQLN
jgi:hypothetical protein